MPIIEDLQSVETIVWNAYDRPLAAMRRTQLWRLADLHQIAYPRGASKEVMIRLIENWEMARSEGAALQAPVGMSQDTFLKAIQGPEVKHDEMRAGQATGQTNVDIFKDAIEGVSHFETDRNVDNMTMPELRKEAKRLNLPQKPTEKAEELRAKIRGKDAT